MPPDPRPETAPVVAWHGTAGGDSPLVVLLHGRGSDEHDILSLAPRLPDGLAYAAVRGPIEVAPGYTWFENEGIGVPLPDSLRESMRWFNAWLAEMPPSRRVFLIGFSAGALFAGALVLSDPSRYAGAALLCGALPFDTGIDLSPGRLAGLPVFVAQGDSDTVIPRPFLDRAWNYLVDDSGGTIVARRDPVEHTVATGALTALAGWLHALVPPERSP